ncbi:transcriptional regulator [Tsukamurella soli]|uniref:Transcriptional regulator n=1 Tax=Tsukamurella soli TaxID=644556 RepID=A0ABP8JSX2_9ACTN
MSAPESAFDDLIHPRQRLMLCAALTVAEEVRFDLLAKALEVSPPTLSKHVARLAEAGYVSTRPDKLDSRRLWVRLTDTGTEAYRGHVQALRELTSE